MKREITHREQNYDEDGNLITEKYTVKIMKGKATVKEETHTYHASFAGPKKNGMGYKKADK
jgi:hypothetical protein